MQIKNNGRHGKGDEMMLLEESQKIVGIDNEEMSMSNSFIALTKG